MDSPRRTLSLSTWGRPYLLCGRTFGLVPGFAHRGSGGRSSLRLSLVPSVVPRGERGVDGRVRKDSQMFREERVVEPSWNPFWDFTVGTFVSSDGRSPRSGADAPTVSYKTSSVNPVTTD